jgi:RNA polymerase sigma factor (sigma-70 family)
MQNEEEIISRVLVGDLYSFRLLVKQYERLVICMVNRVIQQHEDEEDVCQEVFIKVYKNLPGFKFQSKLSTWIAQIAYSTALNHLKKISGKKNLTSDIADFENYHQVTDNPESILLKKDNSSYIKNEINKLPLQYRTVITLYHLNEMSYHEIEEITGMPEGTVKSYLFRARKLLKDRLEHYLNKQ